ncbi:MAG: AAA family ATPase [Sandaracinaceae bacterium]|nr:AAA family ATPase [Sandaracinaceae bacterium]
MFLLLAGCGGEAPAPDAAVAMDAGVPELVEPSDAGMDAGPADAAVDPRDLVRFQIRALTELLEGRLPTDVDPQSLFEADLLDEGARVARIHALEARLAHAAPPDAGFDAGFDAGPLDGDVLDGEVRDGEVLDGDVLAPMDAGVADAGHDAGALDDAGALLDADVLDGDVLADGGLEDAGPPDAGPRAPLGELETLELERDRLRLAFLRLPEAERTRVVEAVRARRRIAVEEHASRADAERAAQDILRAEEASDDLFSQAAGSSNPVESALLAERARIETVRAEFARWEVRFARRREDEARAGAVRLQRLHELEHQVTTVEGAAADDLYDDVVQALVVQRAEVHALLDELDAPSEAPSLELSIDLSAGPYRGLDGARELRQAVAEFESDRMRAVGEEERLRWAWGDRKADDLRRLDQVRVDVLPRMSRQRRASVLGLGREGRAQLGRELEEIATLARYWARETWHDLPTLPARLGALALGSETRVPFALAFLLFLGIGIAWRQRELLTERLRTAVHLRAPVSQRSWRALLRPFWAVLGPLAVPLAILIALHVLMAILTSITDSLFFAILRVVALRIAWFSFLVTLVGRFFVSRLRHGAGRARTTQRIFASVRLVLGYWLAVVLITDLSELLVGHGYIYGLVVELAWLGGLPIAVLLIHRWADDICEAHRRRWPTGFVARTLDKSSTRARRYALTPIAAIALAGAGGYAAFEELALRFEQFRRALAFLFRRRLERRVEVFADESQMEELPQALRDAFIEVPGDRALEIDRFPRLDEIVGRVNDSLAPDEVGLVLAVVGERGIGKTTWLRELARRVEAETVMLDVPHRLSDSTDVCLWLSKELGLPPLDSAEAVGAALDALETPRVVILDHCQNLVVRAIGGTAGLEALVELAAMTSRRVTWICSFALYTWRYLERARQQQDLFREHLLLEPWTEEDIAALIRHRMAACDHEVSYRDLVVEKLAGSALEDAVVRTEGEYLRLLWDFAGGNPRVAIHFWKHSLSAGPDGALKVRLFSAPDDDDLNDLHETSLFLLATIALHENATLAEAATSAGAPLRECSALLSYLRDRGYLSCDAQGYWRLSTHWYRILTRHLRRKRLLFD